MTKFPTPKGFCTKCGRALWETESYNERRFLNWFVRKVREGKVHIDGFPVEETE